MKIRCLTLGFIVRLAAGDAFSGNSPSASPASSTHEDTGAATPSHAATDGNAPSGEPTPVNANQMIATGQVITGALG